MRPWCLFPRLGTLLWLPAHSGPIWCFSSWWSNISWIFFQNNSKFALWSEVPWVAVGQGWTFVYSFPFLGNKNPKPLIEPWTSPRTAVRLRGARNLHGQIPVWLLHVPVPIPRLLSWHTSLLSPSAATPSFPSDGTDPLLLLIPKERELDNFVHGLWPFQKDSCSLLEKPLWGHRFPANLSLTHHIIRKPQTQLDAVKTSQR